MVVFFMTAEDAEELLIRNKELYDGAVPSGNSIAFMNLIRLSALTGDTSYEEKARKMAMLFQPELERVPLGYTEFLIGLDYLLNERYEIVIVADISRSEVNSLLISLRQVFIPGKVIVVKPDHSKLPEKYVGMMKHFDFYKSMDGIPIFYVCKNNQCSPPTDDVKKVLNLLGVSK